MSDVTVDCMETIRLIKQNQKELVASVENISIGLKTLAEIFNRATEMRWKEFIGDNSGIVYVPVSEESFMCASHTLDWDVTENILELFLDNDNVDEVDFTYPVFLNEDGEWKKLIFCESDDSFSSIKSMAVDVDIKVPLKNMENFFRALSNDLGCSVSMCIPYCDGELENEC